MQNVGIIDVWWKYIGLEMVYENADSLGVLQMFHGWRNYCNLVYDEMMWIVEMICEKHWFEYYDLYKWFWEKPCQNTVANGSRR